MKTKILLILSAILLLNIVSCKDYSDLELKMRTQYIDIIDPFIEVALTGKEPITGTLRVKIYDEIVGEDQLSSNIESKYSVFKFDIDNLSDSSRRQLSLKIWNSNRITLNLVFSNEEEKVWLQKSISVEVKLPPFSKIENIQGSNFESTYGIKIVNLREAAKFDSFNFEAGLISRTIILKSRFDENRGINSYKEILKKGQIINVKLLVDTVYYKTAIIRYQIPTNSESTFERAMIKIIQDKPYSIKTDFKGKKEDDYYVIEDNFIADFGGLVGLYLINIEEDGNYYIKQFGEYLVDMMCPEFSNSSYCYFNGDPWIEGKVCLETKHFEGYNPYKVPFVGYVHGDVSKLYVDNKQIPFKTGDELYFKKRIYLDDGYNRILIKIIDKRGNITEGYIPVTMKLIRPTIDVDID